MKLAGFPAKKRLEDFNFEFLKELDLAEGRGTGIPKIRRKMRENGSPEPKFEFDAGRTYFRVILPAHPQYVVIHSLRNSAHLWATGDRKGALANLEQALKKVPTWDELIELAILYKRAGRLREAHKVFASNFDILRENQKAVHEYAQTKNILASKERDWYVRKRLNQEAAELLRRAIQLSDDKVRTAWCWFDLARTLSWLRSPESDILNAYSKAMELLPDEAIFIENYEKWKANHEKWRKPIKSKDR
ncbi:Uncharacterised protein [uncultured archaeon]|nr:Uncharacterised protein [uncultured archaeon]